MALSHDVTKTVRLVLIGRRVSERWIARTTRSEGSSVRIIDTSFFFAIRGFLSPLLVLYISELTACKTSSTTWGWREDKVPYSSCTRDCFRAKWIMRITLHYIFFLWYSLLLFSLWNKYLTSIMPAWNLPFFYNIWFSNIQFFLNICYFITDLYKLKWGELKYTHRSCLIYTNFTYKRVMCMFVEKDANNIHNKETLRFWI